MKRYRPVKLAVFALAVGASIGRSDSIYLYNQDGSAALKPFRENVTLLRAKGDALIFRTGSGLEQTIEIAKISQLSVTTDASLTEAEDAYVSQKFDAAVDLYQKALRSGEAWKVQWITPRLSKAAAQTKRFDAALSAFIGFAKIDPPAALAHKPELPAKGSKFLDDASKQLEASVREAASDGEKQALLSLLLDIQMQRGDTAAAESTADALLSMKGSSDDPRLASMVVSIRIDQAEYELRAGRPERVAGILNPIRARISAAENQAKALYLLARADAALAGNDPGRQFDAAISFMRVASHFASVDGKPYVAQSMLDAASLCRKCGQVETARSLYRQIVAEFAGSPFAKDAAEQQSQLSQQ